MGHLLNGTWSFEETLVEQENGKYVKKPSLFRNRVSADGSSGFKAEPGRYHLYSSIACPWAHRAVIFRVLKKLEGLITLTDTEQDGGGQGWAFAPAGQVVPGADGRLRFVHQLYTLSDPRCTTRVTVPVLWDALTRQIVSNESSEIMRMFNTEFAELTAAAPDYYPAHLRAQIEAMNAFVLARINNGVNECGRSTGQQAYEAAFDRLFSALDTLEDLLGRQRYLCGERQTEADWRLFPSLIRFDPVYHIGYKCNLARLEDYPNLSNYLRDLYQTPGIAEASDIAGMKRGAFAKAGPIGSNGIIPKGPELDHGRAHDRGRFARVA